MLDISQSTARSENEHFSESKRQKQEDNIAWLERHYPTGTQATVLVLFGGNDTASFRLRVAQSYARHNLTPSYWSHVVLLRPSRGGLLKASTWEVNLSPPGGFGFVAEKNAIQSGKLKHFRDAEAFPNVALLHVPASRKDVEAAIKRFTTMRNVVNGAELVIAWLAYIWGASAGGNPLLAGQGIPGAVLVEYAVGAAGFDLTPGLASQSSCPEAIWQTAKWWHEYSAAVLSDEDAQTSDAKTKKRGGKPDASKVISGAWCVHHELP